MKIKEAESFIFNLQLVSLSENIYLSRSADGRFTPVALRDNKNLNTARIAQLAKECRKSLNTEQLSSENRNVLKIHLGNALISYHKRVQQTKPLLARLLCLKNRAEKQLENIVLQTRCHLTEAEMGYLKNVELIQNHFKRACDIDYQLNQLYHKVLDSESPQRVLGGMLSSESIRSLLEDLLHFNAHTQHKHPVIDQLIQELLFAHEIAYLQDCHAEQMNRLLAKKVLQKIEELPISKPDQWFAILIPGGTQSHGILYSIRKEEDSTFSLTLINSGSGTALTDRYELEDGTVVPLKKESFVEVKITDLKQEQLSLQFLTELLQLKQQDEIKMIHEFLRKHLVAPDQSNVVYLGPPHKTQNNETCAVKRLSAMLRDRMGRIPRNLSRA